MDPNILNKIKNLNKTKMDKTKLKHNLFLVFAVLAVGFLFMRGCGDSEVVETTQVTQYETTPTRVNYGKCRKQIKEPQISALYLLLLENSYVNNPNFDECKINHDNLIDAIKISMLMYVNHWIEGYTPFMLNTETVNTSADVDGAVILIE